MALSGRASHEIDNNKNKIIRPSTPEKDRLYNNNLQDYAEVCCSGKRQGEK